MGRPATSSTTLLRAVREYFGLTLETLASYLRVSVGLVSHLEAGRRTMSAPLGQGLAALAGHLATPAPDPAAHLAPPTAAPLATRLATCQHQARKLRRELAALAQQLEIARRWQLALPALLAQAPDERARAWLGRRQAQAAADLDGETAARYHLLRLRAEALEGEAAALAALLPPAAG